MNTLINQLIAIGSSTGGTKALEQIIPSLPIDMPPILVVQHLPKVHTKTFSSRLNQLSKLHVKEAEHNEKIQAGTVYIAPGDQHMVVKKTIRGLLISLNQDEKVSYHRPSADVLFNSVSKSNISQGAIGIILTGMGRDGAKGLKAMKDNGAYTIAQDKSTSVVYGMPKEAAQLDTSIEVLPLGHISSRMISLSGSKLNTQLAM